jgi:PAS domain S-box-containing protein
MSYFLSPRRIPIAIFILLAVILRVSTAAASEEPIRFAGDRDFPPIEYLEQDVPRGLNVDLLRELSKAMGRRIDIQLMPWEEAQKKLLSGEIDAITTMSITDKRKELYDFSEITRTYQYSFFVKTGQVTIQNPRDLEGKAVAVTGSGLPSQVLQMVPGIKFVFIEDYLEGFRLLLSQEIDAVAADRWVGAYTLQKNDLRGITIIEKPFAEMNAGIAVKKGNTKLLDEINLAIRKLKNDGTIKRIEDKWLPKEILFLTREQIYEKAAYVIVMFLIVVIGAAFFWILSLRKANNSLRESRRIALNLKDEALDARHKTDQALEALHQSRMDLDRAQEVGKIGWWRLDTKQNVLTWSDENHRIFGVPKGMPLTYQTFLEIVHPDDRTTVDTQCLAGKARDSFDFEHRIIVDGQLKWVREKAYLEFDDSGKLLGAFGITQDITERKHSEEALRESVAMLNTVLETLPAGVIIADAGGRIVRDNAATKELWGIPPETKSWEEYHHWVAWWPETGQRILAHEWAMARALLHGEVTHSELIENQRFNSEERRYYLNNVAPLRNDKGLITGAVAAMLDVTDRLAAEHALKAANERNLTILESITDGFLALDKEWRYTYFNETGARMIGMKRDDLIGGCVWELFPHATSTRFYAEYHRAVETGTPIHFEEYYPDPLDLWLECHCYPIPEGLTVFFRDISERKRTEQALQRAHGLLAGITQGTQDLIAAQDTEYRYLFFNDAYALEFKRLWGQDIEVGTSMTEAMAQWPEDLRRAKDLWGRALSGESFSVTTQFGPSERTTQAYDLHFSPVHDAQGRQIGAAHILRNVTEQVLAQKALHQLNETLEAQVAERTALAQARTKQLQGLAVELIETEERERRRFAELLHEDLQQMLASARFQLQAVSADLPTEPMLANVIRILEESIAKSRSLSHELSPPVLHYSDLYAAFVWLARQMGEQFGLAVQLEADKPPQIENGPLKVFVFRAVQEFLFNTVKHAEVKSARIVLSSLNGNFQVSVSDEGQGFDKNILDSDNAKTGFGLIAIRERAHYMGGRLKIESMPGQGARLSLIVPINFVPKNDRNHPVEHSLDDISQKKFSSSEGLRVLFADDHKVMRQGLIRLISGQPGIQVVGEAANGREALELTLKLKPDVVVMDINMPEMDGIEATRFIKTELPKVRVIGLSMHEDDSIYRIMRDAGADAFVIKTASSAELLKAIYGSK